MKLEKQFFDTFGIKPKYKCTKDGNCYFQECSKCGWYIRTYPTITDHILLELICILSQHYSLEEENWFLSCDSIDYLKQFILSHLIELKENTWFCSKHQVQSLFEEG